MGTRWLVRLGRDEWLRFTYERQPADGLTLLGSVQLGARVGALAMDSQGQYVQVNGDFISPLSASQVRAAVAIARRSAPPDLRHDAATPRPSPVVVVKRKSKLARSEKVNV